MRDSAPGELCYKDGGGFVRWHGLVAEGFCWLHRVVYTGWRDDFCFSSLGGRDASRECISSWINKFANQKN